MHKSTYSIILNFKGIKLIVDFQNFPYGYNLAGDTHVDIGIEDILKSSVSVVNAFGASKTINEIKWRQHMVLSYLEEVDSQIVRTNGFRYLDPSEKGGISFYLAMAATVAVAKEKLKFRSVVHFDSLLEFWDKLNINSGVSLRSGRKRPDLVGFRFPHRHSMRAGYQIQRGYFECKGRSNGFNNGAMNSAIAQLQNIRDRNSVLKVASQFYFQGSMNSFQGVMIDPPVNDLFSAVSDEDFSSAILTVEAMPLVKIAKESEENSIHEEVDRVIILDKSDNKITIDKLLYKSVEKISNYTTTDSEVLFEFRKIRDLVVETRSENLFAYDFQKKQNVKKTSSQYASEVNSDLIRFLKEWGGENYLQAWLKFLEMLLLAYRNEKGSVKSNDTGVYQQGASKNLWSLKVLGCRVGLVNFKSQNSFEINLGFPEGDKYKHLNEVLVRIFVSSNNLPDEVSWRIKERGRELIVIKFNNSRSFMDSQSELIEMIKNIYHLRKG